MGMPNLVQKHIGRKIEGVRKIKKLTQEQLGGILGLTQQAINKIEQSATITENKLKEIAMAMDVSVETIENFNEEAVINYFNNFYDNATVQTLINHQQVSNEKLVELYEKLLKEKDATIENLRKQLKAS